MATRLERVVLELEDRFTRPTAQATVAAKGLDSALNDLDGSATRAGDSSDHAADGVKRVGDESERSSKKTDGAGKQIDKLSGRLRLLTEAAVTLGPALIPIGAATIPALAGLTAGFGAAAGAVGVSILAFNGVGDALGALNAYQLEQTPENLAKMREEFDKLGPAGEHFVRFLDGLGPSLSQLQQAAREGLLPGVEEGITELLTLLPQVQRIITNLSTSLGGLAADAGGALSGPGFAEFFDYVESDAGPTLTQFGHIVGNLAEGLASLLVAFAPLSRDFTGGFDAMAASFANWAAGLSQTQGFTDFVDYVRRSGPQVLDLLGALASAFVGIVTAAAPFGSAVLPVLTALADILGVIANSPVGPVFYTAIAGVLAFSRAADAATASMTRLGLSAEATSGKMALLNKAGVLALAAYAGAGVVDSLQKQYKGFGDTVSETAQQLDALAKSGGSDKLSHDLDGLADAYDRLTDPNKAQSFQDFLYNHGAPGSDSNVDKAKAQFDAIDKALVAISQTEGPARAKVAFDALTQSLGGNSLAVADLVPRYRELSDTGSVVDLIFGGLTTGSDQAASATRNLTVATHANSAAQRAESKAIRDAVDAMHAKRDATLAAFCPAPGSVEALN